MSDDECETIYTNNQKKTSNVYWGSFKYGLSVSLYWGIYDMQYFEFQRRGGYIVFKMFPWMGQTIFGKRI